jgi:hypothetical protein
MTAQNDTMLDIESEINSKSRLRPILLLLFAANILLISTVFFFRLYNSSKVKNFDIILFSIMVTIPTSGALLFAFKKKLGYIICFFYFELITFSFLAVIFQRLIENERLDLGIVSFWTPYCISALSLPICLLILTKDIQAYMSISTKRLRQTVVISTLLVLAFVVMLWQN